MSEVTTAMFRQLADELEIRNFLGRVAHLSDAGSVADYVDCFTQDASLEVPGQHRSGRSEIGAGSSKGREGGTQGPGSNTRHFVTNHVLHVDGSEIATSESSFIFVGGATTPVVLATGRYEDTLERTTDGWKLARRQITFG